MCKKIIDNYGTTLKLNEAENYLLCGALAKTMQRIGRHDFDYWFFSGITGDTFTQVFSRNFNKYYDCFSSAIFSKEHLDNIFSAIGYDYTLINNAEFYQNPQKCYAKIKEWIDNNVPVIVKDTADSWYSLAVGYEDDIVLKFDMLGNELQPYSFDLSENSNYALIFVGDMVRDIDVEEVYKNAVLAVPVLLNAQSTDETSFGKQAFIDWSDSLIARRNEFLSDYFDWVGTNAHMKIVLERAFKSNPNLKPFIDKLMRFADMNTKLYWCKNEAQQAIVENNKLKLKEISERIKELAIYCDEIIATK